MYIIRIFWINTTQYSGGVLNHTQHRRIEPNFAILRYRHSSDRYVHIYAAWFFYTRSQLRGTPYCEFEAFFKEFRSLSHQTTSRGSSLLQCALNMFTTPCLNSCTEWGWHASTLMPSAKPMAITPLSSSTINMSL